MASREKPPGQGTPGSYPPTRSTADEATDNALYRGLVEAAPDAFVGVNAEGEIVLVNVQAERLFGYSRRELIGQPVELLVPAAERALHRKHRTSYAARPVTRQMGLGLQLSGRRRDGSEFPAEISLATIDTGRGLLIAAAVRDVTERQRADAERAELKAQAERERLERQLHQAQRLESLGQLAGGVAHDFNNLLAVISNYAAFVSEEVATEARKDPERWEQVLADLAEIERAAGRAAHLTRQLLTFGRREVVHPVALDLNEVVRDVDRLLRRTLGEHIELVTIADDRAVVVLADGGQLEQVLVNLAVNARDAMPHGGTLVLETNEVTVDDAYTARRPAVAPGRYARLRVSDTGSGMDTEVVARAFEPFFTTKPKGEGSGLGLSTVFGIVTQAGGDLEIYSEIGLGTTISMLLPLADVPVQAPNEATPGREARGTETVLVIEDEDAIREVTRRILARNGYEVITAADGEEGLDAVRRSPGPISLVITDVVMPGMLGKQVAERIWAIAPHIQVLYMSGYARPILAAQGTLDPGESLVEKPFSEQLLLTKVREVLDRRAVV